VIVRASTESDVAAIAEIYAHHVLHGTGTFEIAPPGLVEMRRRREEILQRGLPFLVGEVEGAVAGYAYAGPYRTREAYRFTLEDSIYIHPDRQNRGYGTVLLKALLRSCAESGFRQMIAVIGDSRNVASVRLHERCGFRAVGTLKDVGYKFGEWIDAVIMQRDLGGPPIASSR
jgi:phosphinothricin acetyltransferase